MKRRAFLSGLAGAAAVASAPMIAPAAKRREAVTVSATYAVLNCNWAGYSAGSSAEGYDLTWATGSGSSRRYIRSKRLADQLRLEVKASLYAVIECDEQMAADLCKLMGTQWRYIGCEDEGHDKNGWLYDSNKWDPGNLAVTILPGGGNRRLLAVGFFHIASGIMLSCSVSHLSSNAPGDRALQIDKILDASAGKNRLMGIDLNASSPAEDSCPSDPAELALEGPRTQLSCRGWRGYGESVGGWHGYDSDRDMLAIDYVGVSPTARENGKISMRSPVWFDTRTNMTTDHCILKCSVDFT